MFNTSRNTKIQNKVFEDLHKIIYSIVLDVVYLLLHMIGDQRNINTV